MAALMGALVDLMVYDLEKEKDGVSMEDFEECIAEFMLNQFSVEDDPENV